MTDAASWSTRRLKRPVRNLGEGHQPRLRAGFLALFTRGAM